MAQSTLRGDPLFSAAIGATLDEIEREQGDSILDDHMYHIASFSIFKLNLRERNRNFKFSICYRE